jgi:hypothetical protein
VVNVPAAFSDVSDVIQMYPGFTQKYSRSIPDVPMCGNADNGFTIEHYLATLAY